jgi:hypothetical protein
VGARLVPGVAVLLVEAVVVVLFVAVPAVLAFTCVLLVVLVVAVAEVLPRSLRALAAVVLELRVVTSLLLASPKLLTSAGNGTTASPLPPV